MYDNIYQTSAIASSSIVWSAIGNPTGSLTLSMAGYTTTFDQTSAVAWLWANTTAATLDANVSSPLLQVAGTYYGAAGGSLAASAADTWSVQNVLANGAQLSGTSAITHIAESAGSVVTLTLVGSAYVAGEVIELSGLSAGAWLNGYCVQLITGTATTCTFNDPTSSGSLSSTALTGTPVMTRVDNLSTLTFSHTGSPVAGSVAFPTATNVTIGTPNSIAGTLTLSSASSANQVVLANSSGNVLTLTATGTGGAITLSAASGLNLIGSGAAEVGLATVASLTGGVTSNSTIHQLNTNTAATSSQSVSTGLQFNGNYWTGSASARDTWQIENVLTNGSNGASTLTFTHTGSTGLVSFQLPDSGAAPTSAGTAGTAGQVLYHSGLLYFCSVSGAAGSATWNKLSMTSV